MYTSSALHPRDRSFTGAFNPCKIGPTASNPPRRCAILYPILPASKLGNTNTLASPCTFELGAFNLATEGTTAASNCNSPSTANSGAFSLTNLVASATLVVSSVTAEPKVEKLNIATFGSTLKLLAVFALSIAISARPSASNVGLIAQSANT